MRASAEWSPKLRWLSSRILLFIPSSQPLLSLHVTHAMTPSKWLRMHLRHAFDGLYPRAHSAPQPSSEKLLGPCLGFVGVEVHEVVAQKHGAVEATISSHLLAEHPFVFRAACVCLALRRGKLGVLEVASGSPL